MDELQNDMLRELIAGFAEPLLVARVDSSDWPVVLTNPAFQFINRSETAAGKPLADVIEDLLGRDIAVEVSEAVRSAQDTTIPVEMRSLEYSLQLVPLGGDSSEKYYAAYWRTAGTNTIAAAGDDAHQALLRAKRRIRDLSRDDPVTGLFNETAFREILSHDWAVAERENSTLSLVCFTLDDFAAYREVFGRHASDTCIRRVGQAIKRFLRRASDVAARIGDDKLVVLSHSSEKSGVEEFAERIATSVRDLGLHHPRSETEKFVTVSFRVKLMKSTGKKRTAESLLTAVMKS